ncbi:MAG: META domain-containing protein [Rikenellaceae bacterium]
MKRFIASIVAVMVVGALAVGCCPCRKGSAERVKLESTVWQLSQIGGRNETPVEDQYTLSFAEDGKVGGVAKCNRLTGSYVYNANKSLKFDHMGMTRMMCPPGGDFEDEFAQMLGKVTHYEVDGDMLILLSNGNTVALMRRVQK